MSATASCHFPYLDEWKDYCEKNRICEFIDSTLSGYAQVAFTDNTFTGILLIAITWLGSPIQCISGLWATFISTLCAYLFHLPKGLIRCGLYGFNGALAGLAVPLLILPGESVTLRMFVISTIAGILCVIFQIILDKICSRWDMPSLSAPYCIAFLILMITGSFMGTAATAATPTTMIEATLYTEWTFAEFISAALSGTAQMLWISRPICGFLYFFVLLTSSRIDAVTTLIATLTSTSVAIFLGFPKDGVLIGLYTYNSILLMRALTRSFIANTHSVILCISLSVFTTSVCGAFEVVLASFGLSSFLAIPYVVVCFFIYMTRNHLPYLTYVPGRYWGVPETINRDYKNGKIILNE